MTKKVFIKTWGCQMNAYDSDKMSDIIAPLGYSATNKMSEADLVIFNTCHIREKATEKLFSELGRFHKNQLERAKRGEKTLIAVAGCVAQAIGPEIQRRAPYVDMVFGPQTYQYLPEMIARISRGNGSILNTEFPEEIKFDRLAETSSSGISAFLAIQEGCDKFCSYCVVPYTRGTEYSRSISAIAKEANRLVELGAREITLLGQNVNAYHGEDESGNIRGLDYLISRLSEIIDLKRICYMTSHPNDMTDEIILAHKNNPKLMPFLHLPVQSGADRILATMNRKHSADDYRKIIDKLRAARPDIALSSDFIVGFPGETTFDFKATLRLISDVGFAQAYSFKYSRRPGTPASAMSRQIGEELKEERLQELQALIRQQQDAFNHSSVGKTMPVLFENKGRNGGQIRGRTPYMQSAHAKASPDLIGQEVMVKITATKTNSLEGEVV
ncbi:MAG: tRNA (N6-isopentenyl adenosine(37)-C2)-methylthiotransferase MiaB [Alphaproteobacteria bacterium]|nr:tRNA (N6-isopentenyl adenosine(37)-C2)-methylthiotransferase MiaB [Alphaproteobacteria bacterium]